MIIIIILLLEVVVVALNRMKPHPEDYQALDY